MTRVGLKARIIFSAMLLAFLFFIPLIMACNDDNPSTPPIVPTTPSLNDTAKENLTNFYSKSFFPFEKVTVLEIEDTDSSSEIKFNFTCTNIVEVKVSMANNLYTLGFTQTINDGFNMIDEDNEKIINITITESKNNYTFVANKHDYIAPDVKDPIEVKISEIVGFDFNLGELVNSATDIEFDNNKVRFLLANVNFVEACEVIKTNFAGTSSKILQSKFMLTIILKSDSSSITLMLANDDHNLAFSVTKR